MLPSAGGPAGCSPSFLFKKTPEATGFLDAQTQLLCPIAGAVFLRKLVESSKQDKNAAAKKRARAPDLSAPEQQTKKAKCKAKGKAKAKAKAQAQPTLEPDTMTVLEADVAYSTGQATETGGLPEGARQRLWLDDLFSCSSGEVQVLLQEEWQERAG